MGTPIIHLDAWPICRRYSELELSRRLTLLQWAERGRLLSGDYVFDPDLDTWICAREQAELKMFFQKQKVRRAQRLIALLLGFAALSLCAAPLLATVLVISAGAIFIHYSGLSLQARWAGTRAESAAGSASRAR